MVRSRLRLEDSRRRVLVPLALTAGFLALAGGLVLAGTEPARGYEVSVYGGTPAVFWGVTGVALLVGATVALTSLRYHRLGLLLAGGTVTSWIALPLIRGYYYYGQGDALTHLGWAGEMAASTTAPQSIIYPGIHVLAVFVHQLAGMPLSRAFMFVVLVFAVLFVVAVTATVWSLTRSVRGAAVGMLASFTLLPINGIVTELEPHPISLSILFFGFVFYLLVRYLLPERGEAGNLTSAEGALLTLALAATVLLHPMQQFVVVVLFAVVAAVQRVFRLRDGLAFLEQRSMVGPTAVAVVAFVGWIALHETAVGQMEVIALTIGRFVVSGGQVGTVVAERGASLTAIGAGFVEVFLKLFLVDAVFSLLAAGVALQALRRGTDRRTDVDGVVTAVAFGVGIVGLTALLHLVGPLSTLFFRYLGAIMVAVTVLGALAVYRLADRAPTADRTTWPVVSLVLVLAVALSFATLYPSPFVYQASAQQSHQQLGGYLSAFEHADDDVEFVGIRSDDWRYRHAIYGPTDQPWDGTTIPPEALDDPTAAYESDRYLAVTAGDRQRETVAYRGLRYDDGHFRSVQSSPGVSRVSANGDFQLYLIDGEANASASG